MATTKVGLTFTRQAKTRQHTYFIDEMHAPPKM